MRLGVEQKWLSRTSGLRSYGYVLTRDDRWNAVEHFYGRSSVPLSEQGTRKAYMHSGTMVPKERARPSICAENPATGHRHVSDKSFVADLAPRKYSGMVTVPDLAIGRLRSGAG